MNLVSSQGRSKFECFIRLFGIFVFFPSGSHISCPIFIAHTHLLIPSDVVPLSDVVPPSSYFIRFNRPQTSFKSPPSAMPTLPKPFNQTPHSRFANSPTPPVFLAALPPLFSFFSLFSLYSLFSFFSFLFFAPHTSLGLWFRLFCCSPRPENQKAAPFSGTLT